MASLRDEREPCRKERSFRREKQTRNQDVQLFSADFYDGRVFLFAGRVDRVAVRPVADGFALGTVAEVGLIGAEGKDGSTHFPVVVTLVEAPSTLRIGLPLPSLVTYTGRFSAT